MALAMALRPLSSAVDKTVKRLRNSGSLLPHVIFTKRSSVREGKTWCLAVSMEKSATLCRPKLIVAGAIDYARLYDYARIRKVLYDYADKINQAVFPGLQGGGAHNHTITDLAVALKQTLIKKGYELVSGGTESHLVLVNLKNKCLSVLESVHIAPNKNVVPGDVSAMVPGGIRMGTPALTSRGFVEEDFVKVAEFFDATAKLAVKIKAETQGTKVKDFVTTVQSSPPIQSEISKLPHEVEEYAKQFPTVGFKKETMKYKN